MAVAMMNNVEQDILRKIERERNIIQGASNLKKRTDNVMVIQKCNTNIREAQQNIQYLEDTLKKLHLESQAVAVSQVYPGYRQLSTMAPHEHRFSRLDLSKYDCPSLSQRIQYMLQQLEFKLRVERQYQEANDKLTKLYQIDGDQRSSSAAQGGAQESKQRIQLLTRALKKYQALNVDMEQLKEQADDVLNSQPKFRRKQLTGEFTIGLTAIRDIDHIQSPLFSKNPETIITVKVDDVVRAKTKPTRTDRWHEEFTIHVDKGNELEITVYDRINDRIVPVAVMWLLLSDVAEEIRKKKVGQVGSPTWLEAASQLPDASDPYLNTSTAHLPLGGLPLATRDQPQPESAPDTAQAQPITTSAWFVLEPAGQIMLTLGFSKSNQNVRKDLPGGLRRHGAIVNRKDDVYEKHGHHFVQKSFYNIMCCAYCGDFLRYSGFQCQDCKFLCHKKCYNNVVTKCIAKTSTDSDPEEAKLNHHIPHRFEPVSNRGTKWCCHCGYILPWGKKNVRKCSECSIMCHTQCAHLVPDFCGMTMEMANKILTTIQDTKRNQQQRQKSSPAGQMLEDANKMIPYNNTASSFEAKGGAAFSKRPTASAETSPTSQLLAEDQSVQPYPDISNLPSGTSSSEPQDKHTKRQTRLIYDDDDTTEDSAYYRFSEMSGQKEAQAESPTLDPGSVYLLNDELLDDQPTTALMWQTMKEEEEQRWLLEQRKKELSKQINQEAPAQWDPQQNPFNSDPSESITQRTSAAEAETSVQLSEPPKSLSSANYDNYVSASNLELPSEEVDSVPQLPPAPLSPPKVQPSGGRHKRKTPKRRKVSLDDFILLKVLGKGNFGKVLLARSKNTDRLCAIKVLKKDHIIQNHDIESARAEKKVFLLATKAKHPFLTNLYCSFQTENRIYFAMEFIGGGDLMWHVQNQRLSVRRAKFYAAEVLLALKYFHDNGIIYRDLKLENILLTLEGHIKIADYGLCKDEMWFGNRTSTFCGTPEFMAPEILREQAYTKAVDWWAFGVLLYQMLLCQSPFSGDDEDEVFNAILTDEPLYPIDMAGDIVQIFQGLLTKDPEKRLGAGSRDALEVMEEPFFRNINFDDILNLRVEPPYIPTIKAADDTSYFEKEFTAAPPTLTPLPSILSSNLQEEFRGFSFMPDDLVL
ncbi:AaceriACR191Cp [[Ashbya] aceris (nom. inval.)]|nr:AaceriACR191Cp [[Ashbya] aceris (nom. inval.)]